MAVSGPRGGTCQNIESSNAIRMIANGASRRNCYPAEERWDPQLIFPSFKLIVLFWHSKACVRRKESRIASMNKGGQRQSAMNTKNGDWMDWQTRLWMDKECWIDRYWFSIENWFKFTVALGKYYHDSINSFNISPALFLLNRMRMNIISSGSWVESTSKLVQKVGNRR